MDDLVLFDEPKAIREFHGEYRWLSNFWPCRITAWGLPFPSLEAAYQAGKCAKQAERMRFVGLTAGQAKRLGRSIVMRPDFDQYKVTLMRGLLALKFAQRSELAARLLATGTVPLIEGNKWNDTFWGVCRGVGQNQLGKLLMERRTELQECDNA